MVLDPLIELIETLAGRIDRHRQALGQSEALTRYVLIDPFLRVLGWDTEDPEQVRPEFSAGSGTPDYALMDSSGQQAEVLIEAKKLGISPEGGLDQIIRYWWNSAARYLATTNGKEWVVYDSKASGDKVVAKFDLGDKDVVGTAVKALFLWRGNYQQVVMPASEPAVVAPPPRQPNPLPPISPPPTSVSKTNLDAFLPDHGAPSPHGITAPDGANFQCQSHGDVLVGVVTWLHQNGKLTMKQCPIRAPGARKRYVVHTQPIHPSGKRFFNPVQVGQFWIETNQSTPGSAQMARIVLAACSEDPAKWLVQLPSP